MGLSQILKQLDGDVDENDIDVRLSFSSLLIYQL